MVAKYGINTPQPQQPTTNYLTSDSLGTPRINTDQNGNIQARHDYLPFGEEIINLGGRAASNGYNADSVREKFTGYQRDLENGLDFAQARYYAPGAGRFTSVDPLMASVKTANPQTMNRYGYALNNPYRMTDPSGMDVSGLDEQTDMAFQQLNELVDHAYEVKQAELDKAREEAEKRKIAQASVLHESLHQQTGPDNHQQGEAPQSSEETTGFQLPVEGPFIVPADKLAKFGTEEDYDKGTAPLLPAVLDGKCPKLPQSLAPDLGPVTNFVQGNVLYAGSEADRRLPMYENNSGRIHQRYEEIVRGTVIFTPNSRGGYDNNDSGNHVAIFLSYGVRNGYKGIYVVDQYPNRVGNKALAGIRFIRAGTGAVTDPSNDARAFAVVYAIRPPRR